MTWVEVRFLLDPALLADVMGERTITDPVREDKHLTACLFVDERSVTIGCQVRAGLTRATVEATSFARQCLMDLVGLDAEFVEPPHPVEVRALDSDAELEHMRGAGHALDT